MIYCRCALSETLASIARVEQLIVLQERILLVRRLLRVRVLRYRHVLLRHIINVACDSGKLAIVDDLDVGDVLVQGPRGAAELAGRGEAEVAVLLRGLLRVLGYFLFPH